MALIGGSRLFIQSWLGHNTFQSVENLAPQWWVNSSNITVNNSGNAECLRSPSNTVAAALSTTNPVLSVKSFDRQAGTSLIFDIDVGGSVTTYKTDLATNTSIRTSQATNKAWVSLNINDQLYRVNGSEFVQLRNDLSTFYRVGIDAPAAAPTISYQAGGTGAFASGVFVSYAYYNSTTGHVSVPSKYSNTLGASGANQKIRIPTVASVQAGVDKVVFFITVDGGSVPYLIIDASGNIVTATNATANNDIDIAGLLWNTLSPEPFFNSAPPTNFTHIFKWKDRVFGITGTNGSVQYSGYEAVTVGQPWESWPVLNIINVPTRGDRARAGIETQIGALILGEKDGYLLSGYPSDKTTGPQATTAVTEHIDAMGWRIGTKSPRTLRNTPFGQMWFDQNKRIQVWSGQGFPQEIALPLRAALDAISTTAFSIAEAEWFQNGKNGGYYVLTASVGGTVNDTLFLVSVYRDPSSGNVAYGFGVSDIAAQCLTTSTVSGPEKLYIGVTDRVRGFLDPNTAGAGWGAAQKRFFEFVLGNDQEFSYYHSMRVDGDLTGLTATIYKAEPDPLNNGSFLKKEPQTIVLTNAEDAGGSYYGMIDMYGHRLVMRLEWDNTDTALRQIRSLRIMSKPKARVI